MVQQVSQRASPQIVEKDPASAGSFFVNLRSLRALSFVAHIVAGSLELLAKLGRQRELNIFFGCLDGAYIAIAALSQVNQNLIHKFFRNRCTR